MAQSRADIIADQLEDLILTGVFSSGERLNETQLAARFGVSRTPLREAFQKLGQSGLVEQIPHRGVFVCQPGPVELLEMFEVMAELEAMCARLAARRADKTLIADLSQAMEHCETEAEKGEANTYYHANDTFHQLIYRASGNAFLVQETIQLKNRLKPYRRLQLQVRHRLAQSVAEHRNLAQAIRNGEEELAAQAARQHVLVQGQRFTDLISALTQSRQASASPERA